MKEAECLDVDCIKLKGNITIEPDSIYMNICVWILPSLPPTAHPSTKSHWTKGSERNQSRTRWLMILAASTSISDSLMNLFSSHGSRLSIAPTSWNLRVLNNFMT